MLDACWLHRLLAWGRSQALLGHFQFASLHRMSANCNARTKLDRWSLCECGLICGCPSILQAYVVCSEPCNLALGASRPWKPAMCRWRSSVYIWWRLSLCELWHKVQKSLFNFFLVVFLTRRWKNLEDLPQLFYSMELEHLSSTGSNFYGSWHHVSGQTFGKQVPGRRL